MTSPYDLLILCPIVCHPQFDCKPRLNSVIVAKAAIHLKVITGFKMDTGLRRYDVTPNLTVLGKL